MADSHPDSNSNEISAYSHANTAPKERGDRLSVISIDLLDRGDSIIYTVVGACFFLGAFLALCNSFWDFGSSLLLANFEPVKVAQSIIKFISDLLLVLIIMEVLGTVVHYLKVRATSLRPFLFIGIISATRGILSIGARLSVGEGNLTHQEFTNSMIELGVNAAVILALGISLKLLGKLGGDQ